MLSKKQKAIMVIIGILSILIGVFVAIPFRSFPGLNKVDNLEIELILDLVLGAVVVLLTIYPMLKKYRLLDIFRENSRVVITMCYFPILTYILGIIVDVVYTLSFDYSGISMLEAVSEKALGIIIALLVIHFVFAVYCILRLHNIIMKLDRVGNVLADIFVLAIIVCFMIVSYRVNSVYNRGFGEESEYFLGNPLLFFIYILLIVGFGLGIKYIVTIIKKDETLIYYNNNIAYENLIKRSEYRIAYNETLDDFENYFDANFRTYEKLEITQVESFANENKPSYETVSLLEDTNEEVTYDDSVDLSTQEVSESKELKEIAKEKEEILSQIEEKNKALVEIRERKNNLEAAEEELRAAKDAYDAALAEYNQFRLDHVATPEPEKEEPKKKVKKLMPAFDKVVEYAKSFSETKGYKVNENAKGNLLKFYLGKKMYLVLQSTNNDYRISFITTPEKFVEYVTSRPGELNVPKNLKDNNWIRLVNKGKEDPKFIRQIIKQAVETAEKQIADDEARKVAERKAKAAERAKERAAKRAAEKAESENK